MNDEEKKPLFIISTSMTDSGRIKEDINNISEWTKSFSSKNNASLTQLARVPSGRADVPSLYLGQTHQSSQ
jgi:hypothetical protein